MLPVDQMTLASAHALPSRTVKTEAELRALIGEPAEPTRAKISNRVNAMTRLFVERSPLVCVATSDAAGNCDLSPRQGEQFNAAQYDEERAERDRRRVGFY